MYPHMILYIPKQTWTVEECADSYTHVGPAVPV